MDVTHHAPRVANEAREGNRRKRESKRRKRDGT